MRPTLAIADTIPFPHRLERRSEPRSACFRMARVAERSGADKRWALLRNFSRNGFGFLTSAEFRPDDLVTVEEYGQNKNSVVTARIRHARREASGWFYGCQVVR